MTKKPCNFREYQVWQDAVAFSTLVYKQTSEMPWFEKKGICDQIQRAVLSIASNIAEGSARPSDAEFAHFLDIALGSAYEVETQLLVVVPIYNADKYSIIKDNKLNFEAIVSPGEDTIFVFQS